MIPRKAINRAEVKNHRVLSILADDRRERKAAELEAWRAANSNRVMWDLFYLIEGPELEHPGDLVPSGPEDAYTHCQLAYHESLARIREAGIDEDGNINFSEVPKGDRATAFCLQNTFHARRESDLLSMGIFSQCLDLGLGVAAYVDREMSIPEVVARIDEHRGGPEWRQLGATNQEQEELDAEFGLKSITEIPPRSKPWTESAFQKKRRAGYEQEKAGA